MAAKKQGLQKFTESETKINSILALKQITFENLKDLTDEERQKFNQIITDKINSLNNEERDNLFYQIDGILKDDTRNQIWESNHVVITLAITNYITEHGRMPSYSAINNITGLSRQTIHKHIKEYRNNSNYLAELERFRLIASKLLANVYQFAVKGDMKAAKLYFELVGSLNCQFGNSTFIQQQNNYIQINGTVLSQENIKQLNQEQLTQLEAIIKIALPQADVKPLQLNNP